MGFWSGIKDYSRCTGGNPDSPNNPCAISTNWTCYINNSWELCGPKFLADSTSNHLNPNFHANTKCALLERYHRDVSSTRYRFLKEMNWTGTNINTVNRFSGNKCSGMEDGDNKKKPYTKFYAYAVGDIKYKNKEESNKDRLDIWVIDKYGTLENCYDGALDSSQTFTTQCNRP